MFLLGHSVGGATSLGHRRESTFRNSPEIIVNPRYRISVVTVFWRLLSVSELNSLWRRSW